ncbi:MAG: acylphosphatase [Desulfobacteraceae bacterium]|jgi:acylphosphatase
MSSEKVRAHVVVHGRVQGVCFRYETQRAAVERGVVGWVRNLTDGTVEAVLEGLKTDVQSAIKWCHQGPPAARVDKLDIDWLSPTEETFESFEIRYTV